MTQEELEALLKQHAPGGFTNRWVPTESTETVEIEEPDPYGGSETTKRKVPVKVLQWVDPGTGYRITVQAKPDGTYTKIFQGVDPKAEGDPAITPAQQAATAGASERKPVEGKPGVYQVTTKTQRPDGGSDTETHYEDESGGRVPTPTAQPGRIEEPVKGKPGVKVVKTTNPQTGLTETHYENDAGQTIPPPVETKPPTNVSAPSTQRVSEERTENPDGSYTITPRPNPNWKPETKLVQDPDTKVWTQITETAEGGWTVKPVDGQTIVKPAELPVLQAKYGEISQGLGQLAADLNARFARGEITEKQKNDAFAAGHQQANTQVAEINSILTNSRSAWAQEIEQRGQTLADTAGRRTFAGNVLGQAVGTGQALAISSGPGHGAAIAGGVGALLNIGQRYAEGMGGFRESPEIAMPAAVRQAREVNLPGFGGPAGSGTPGGPLQDAGRSTLGTPPPPPAAGIGAGVSNTTDAGGVPRVMTPASSAPAGQPGTADPSFRRPDLQAPSPATPGFFRPGAAPGVSPLVPQMEQYLQGAAAFAGSPAAAGGAGVFDPLAEGERMLSSRGIGGDTAWEEAVRRAAQAVNQPSQPGYQRFYS